MASKNNNKLLIVLYVPTVEKEYSVFVPVGKTIGAIKTYICDIVSELSEQNLVNKMYLYDKDGQTLYDDNQLLKNTNIKNGTRLILI